MARTPALALLALAAALITPVPAEAAPQQLTASTTVVSSYTGYVDVQLARDVKLSPKVTGNPDVTVSGRGRVIGMSLTSLSTEDWSGLEAYRMPSFAGGQTNVSGTTIPAQTCTYIHPQVPYSIECTTPKPTAILLRRGTYRLHVLTDGSPVTVKLNLRGLTARRSTVGLSRAIFSTQRDLPALEAAGDRLVTFGARTRVPPVPIFVWVIATGTSGAAPHVYEKSACLRRDTAAPPPFAYAPNCPGGESSAFTYTADVNGKQYYGGMYYASISDDTINEIGVGGSLGDSGGVQLKGALAVVMGAVYN